MRQINTAGLAIIKSNEGLRLKAYTDIAGVWTIGYGHTPATPGQVITQAQADALLMQDIAHAASVIEALTQNVPTSDNQFSAMISLAFNIGTGAFRGSSVLRYHLAQDHVHAAKSFLLWDKAHVDGELVVVQGLLKRRIQESNLYNTA